MDSIKFPIKSANDLNTLEVKVNIWLSSNPCWLIVNRLQIETGSERPSDQCLILDYEPPSYGGGPKDQGPWTNCRVQYVLKEEPAELEDLPAPTPMLESRAEVEINGQTVQVRVMLFRCTTMRLALGRNFLKANNKLNQWLLERRGKQIPTSVIAVPNKTEITVDVRLVNWSKERDCQYTATIHAGTLEDRNVLDHWINDSDLDQLNAKFDVIPDRITSNVVTHGVLGSYAVVLTKVYCKNAEDPEDTKLSDVLSKELGDINQALPRLGEWIPE